MPVSDEAWKHWGAAPPSTRKKQREHYVITNIIETHPKGALFSSADICAIYNEGRPEEEHINSSLVGSVCRMARDWEMIRAKYRELGGYHNIVWERL